MSSKERVLDDFAAEYGRGRTPNPCVQCNTHVKFGPLLSWARRHGYGRIATGHYVRTETRTVAGESRVLFGCPSDPQKDQSYVLWGVPAELLEKTLFPLGTLSKAEVRDRARLLGLRVWDKEESQDICFVDSRGYVETLRGMLGDRHPLFQPGPVRTSEGEPRGDAPGAGSFHRRTTQGGGTHPPRTGASTRLEPESNTLIVGEPRTCSTEQLVAEDLNLFVPPLALTDGPVDVKIRYRHAAAPARVHWLGDGRIRVRFVATAARRGAGPILRGVSRRVGARRRAHRPAGSVSSVSLTGFPNRWYRPRSWEGWPSGLRRRS
ncbi:MAG: hypothetical protein R3E12_06495 [Candidatus Eisenbacteria bacterium]